MAEERSPAFQWYPKDFLSSSRVIRMTPTERGIYITLLSVSWLEGGLPDDVEQLARVAGVPFKQFARIWPHNLQSCFSLVKNGRLVNERLEQERDKQQQYRERQKQNGGKGGKAKRNPDEALATPPLQSGNSQMEGSPPSGKACASETEDGDPMELVVSTKREGGVGETPFFADVALRELQEAYPQHRVTYGYRTETAWIQELNDSSNGAADAFEVMKANLENHKRSHEWRVKGMVPALEKWLREGLWKRQMDEHPPVAERLTTKTNKTLQAAADALRSAQ